MADRSIFRVVPGHPIRVDVHALMHGMKQFLPFSAKPRATGFGETIASLEEGSEEAAFKMYAGEFQFSDQIIFATTPQLFQTPLGDSSWQETLLSLKWLVDFGASKRQLHVHYALRLLGRWDKSKRPHRNLGTMSKALIALCTHGTQMALSADEALRAEFLMIVSNAVARCARLKPNTEEQSLLQSVAVLYACTAFTGFENLRKSASDGLTSALNKLTLADGGPASRDPRDLITIMSLLLPLQTATKLNRQMFPPVASEALHRSFPILAMLRCEDGTLTSLFGDLSPAKKISDLANYDVESRPLKLAGQTGFARIAGGKTTLFVDTKSNLLFEFVVAGQQFFKSTSDGFYAQTPAQVYDSNAGIALQVMADDRSERIFFLSADGNDLRVEDHFNSDMQITFALAAQTKITMTREGDVILIAPDQSVWHLSLRGGEAAVEQDGAILKIRSTAAGKMNWAFKKQTKTPKSTLRKKRPEPDLLT